MNEEKKHSKEKNKQRREVTITSEVRRGKQWQKVVKANSTQVLV